MTISSEDFRFIVSALGEIAEADISWSENISFPVTSEQFASEAIWVICNSGMKHTVARQIEEKVHKAINAGVPIRTVFGHVGKAEAMETIWRDREQLFAGFAAAEDKLAWLEALPWIGGITKYHLAKNCGIDCAKPDVHLKRLADREGVSAHDMCARLAKETGYRIATVDVVLWRACATGLLDSRTGEFQHRG